MNSSTPSPTRPLTSIVVGTDFTPCSAAAVAQAIRMAARSNATVHVVHVIDTVVVSEIETALSPMQSDIRANLVRDAREAWTEFAGGIPGASSLRFEATLNNRIAGILGFAQSMRADLLVMGAYGDHRLDVGIGTVATACVRKSGTDVLLVRDHQHGPFKNVVACIDFSDTSALALSRAAVIAADDGARLHILHTYLAPWHQVHYRAPTPLVAPQDQRQYREALERRLSHFADTVRSAHPRLDLRVACVDSTSHRSAIVEYVTGASADLVVLGTRGRTNLRDIFLGSTAEKVLRDSPCSVLAVRPVDAAPAEHVD